jgi:hypothetical protein
LEIVFNGAFVSLPRIIVPKLLNNSIILIIVHTMSYCFKWWTKRGLKGVGDDFLGREKLYEKDSYLGVRPNKVEKIYIFSAGAFLHSHRIKGW